MQPIGLYLSVRFILQSTFNHLRGLYLETIAFTYLLRPPLWSRGIIVASYLTGPGSIPGLVSIPGSGFFCGFSSVVRQMSGKLRSRQFPDIIGHHNHKNHSLRSPMSSDVDALYNLIYTTTLIVISHTHTHTHIYIYLYIYIYIYIYYTHCLLPTSSHRLVV